MKIQKSHRNRLKTAILVSVLVIATPAFAWMGNGWNDRVGYSRTAVAASSLSAEQQKKLDAVQSNYQSRLNDLQRKLDEKSSELAAARANGNTTVAQLNTLERDLFQLERRYWSLLDQANAEAFGVTGNRTGPYFTCSYTGCNHRHHAGPAGMTGSYRSCCW